MQKFKVVYVPVPEDLKMRRDDIAVQETLKMLRRNGFVMQGVARLRDDLGEPMVAEFWTKRL